MARILDSVGDPTIPKPMCNGFGNANEAHVTFIVNVHNKPSSPRIDLNYYIPY